MGKPLRERKNKLDEHNPSGSIAKKHERAVERSRGQRRTPASGSLPGRKSDLEEVSRDYRPGRPLDRTECKATRKRSMSIQLAWLEKITEEALATGRVPVVDLFFENARQPAKDRWVLIERDHYEELKQS